jgi:hypothetical protein
MVKYLYQKCADRKWLQEFGADAGIAPEESALGVAILKSDRETYAAEPSTIDAQFLEALQIVNAKVGLTMSSEITESLFPQISPFQEHLLLSPRLRIPILQSLEAITTKTVELDTRAYACLLREERIVMLWSDTVEGIIAHGADVEDKLMGNVQSVATSLSEKHRNRDFTRLVLTILHQ